MKMMARLMTIFLIVCYGCSRNDQPLRDKGQEQIQEIGLPIVDGSNFGAVNKSGQYIILPEFNYIGPISSSFSELRIFHDSMYLDIDVRNAKKISLDSFYMSNPKRIADLGSSASVKYKNDCNYPSMVELSKSITLTKNSSYIKYESRYSCFSGISLVIQGDVYSYSDSLGTVLYKDTIEGGRLYLAHTFEDVLVRDSIFHSIPILHRDSVFTLGYNFYKYYLPMMFQDIDCDSSLDKESAYNYFLCQEMVLF